MLFGDDYRIVDEDFCLDDSSEIANYGVKCLQHISHCEFLKVKNNVCLLGLKHPSTIYFRGIIEITCLKGEVDIFGFLLTAGKSVEVFSLFGSSAMYFSSTGKSISNSDCFYQKYISKGIPLTKIDKMEKSIGSVGAVVLLTSKMKKYKRWRSLLRNKNIEIFPDYKNAKDLPLFKDAEVTLDCIFDQYFGSRIDRKLFTDISWDQYANSLTPDSRLMICGGNGFGKSTLIRYLINRYLTFAKKLVLVDLDIGQTEMNMPGCISCHIVRKPLLGPNFSHLQHPKWCFYVGNVDPTRCVVEYVAAIKRLISICKSDSSLQGLPWIINTMGFSRGIGILLNCAAVRVVKPTKLLILNSKHLKQLNFFQCLIGNNITSQILHPDNYPCDTFKCDVINVDAPIDSVLMASPHPLTKIPSRKLRNAVETIYFAGQCCEVRLKMESVPEQSDKWKYFQEKLIVSLCKRDTLKTCIGFGEIISKEISKSELMIKVPVHILSDVNLDKTLVLRLEHPIKETNVVVENVPAHPEQNYFKAWKRPIENLDSNNLRAYKVFSASIG